MQSGDQANRAALPPEVRPEGGNLMMHGSSTRCAFCNKPFCTCDG